jgi:MFS transporter, DHA3 family, multidrug efflux protein
MSTTTTRALDLSRSDDRAFVHLLVNTLLVSVINFTVWFAVTFWVFLETKSVLATGMVAGIFLVTTAVTGIWFGSLVDQHAKKTVMQVSAVVSVAFYAVAFTLYVLTPEATFTNAASVRLWIFIVLAMLGVITGNIRSIALQTLVTVLIPEERRDKANGLVGTTLGVSFLVTSVISGLLALCHCPGTTQPALSGAERPVRRKARAGHNQLNDLGFRRKRAIYALISEPSGVMASASSSSNQTPPAPR